MPAHVLGRSLYTTKAALAPPHHSFEDASDICTTWAKVEKVEQSRCILLLNGRQFESLPVPQQPFFGNSYLSRTALPPPIQCLQSPEPPVSQVHLRPLAHGGAFEQPPTIAGSLGSIVTSSLVHLLTPAKEIFEQPTIAGTLGNIATADELAGDNSDSFACQLYDADDEMSTTDTSGRSGSDYSLEDKGAGLLSWLCSGSGAPCTENRENTSDDACEADALIDINDNLVLSNNEINEKPTPFLGRQKTAHMTATSSDEEIPNCRCCKRKLE